MPLLLTSLPELIPSTARSTSSIAAALPSHLLPLLQPALERAKTALSRVLPEVKVANVLEEAEFEEEEGGGFAREKLAQCEEHVCEYRLPLIAHVITAFETLRVYRPRLVICGKPSMGQNFVGPAVLQHLEGFHVQSLELSALVGDATRVSTDFSS